VLLRKQDWRNVSAASRAVINHSMVHREDFCVEILWYRNVVTHSFIHSLFIETWSQSFSCLFILISLYLFYIINSVNNGSGISTHSFFYRVLRVQIHVQMRDHYRSSIENILPRYSRQSRQSAYSWSKSESFMLHDIDSEKSHRALKAPGRHLSSVKHRNWSRCAK